MAPSRVTGDKASNMCSDHVPASSSTSAATHAVGGLVGGVVSRTVTAPADRIRTLMQAGLGVPLRPPGMDKNMHRERYGAFRSNQTGTLRLAINYVWRDGGWKGFFRGNFANCMKMGPDAAVQFAVYHALQKHLVQESKDGKLSLSQRIFSGGVAGAVSQTFIYPLEVIKTRLTVAERGEYQGIVDCIKITARTGTEGEAVIRRFYRGYCVSLGGIVPYMGIKLGLYSMICDDYHRTHGVPINAWRDQLAAASSAYAGIFVAYPLNLVRTKLQTQGVNGRSVLYQNAVDCIRCTVKYEGWKGLYRGFVANSIKALPAQSILLQVQRRVVQALS
eukprot:gnl/MRDRNA2_/MRDRNA2_45989_c0_seq1.p1 gnl/MRDRNA2_/MRDRNA2_45989_c0~~gnl/MRDRNA2_/MRDRNA2_45989_c0_seq1.p1  ORF type:complete len:333 (-),score=38.26 gnl/MRDRNA2_/MRDRNA2_45989_c0_seq1:302-1300(-)